MQSIVFREKEAKVMYYKKKSRTCLSFGFRNLAYIPEVVWNRRPASKGNTLLPVGKDL